MPHKEDEDRLTPHPIGSFPTPIGLQEQLASALQNLPQGPPGQTIFDLGGVPQGEQGALPGAGQGGGILSALLGILKDPRLRKGVGAFGSGFVGQGPEFLQAQRLRQQQELDREAAERQEIRQTEQDVFTRNQQIAKAKREQSVEKRAQDVSKRATRDSAVKQAKELLEIDPNFDFATVPSVSSTLGANEIQVLRVGSVRNLRIENIDQLDKLLNVQEKLQERIIAALARDPDTDIDTLVQPGTVTRQLLGEEFLQGMVNEASNVREFDFAERAKALADAAKAQMLTIPATEGAQIFNITGEPGNFQLNQMQTIAPQLATPGGLGFEEQISALVEGLEAGTVTMAQVPDKQKADVLFSFHQQGKRLPLSDSLNDSLDAADAALSVLEEVERLVDLVITHNGPSARVLGSIDQITAFFGLNTNVEQLRAQVAFVGILARSVGQRGNLSEGEQDRILQLLPTEPTATSETAKANLAEFKRLLLKARGNILRSRKIEDLQREEEFVFQGGVLVPRSAIR